MCWSWDDLLKPELPQHTLRKMSAKHVINPDPTKELTDVEEK